MVRPRLWEAWGPMIQIREATAADDEAIGELLVGAFLTNYARKMPEVVITEQRKADLRAVAEKRAVAKVWVAERDEKIVGTIALWPLGAKGSEAWVPGGVDVRHLAVDVSVQGQGVSTQLIEAAEAWARASGAKSACLHVRRGAKGVRRVYEQRGYLRDPSGDLDQLPHVFLEALFKHL